MKARPSAGFLFASARIAAFSPLIESNLRIDPRMRGVQFAVTARWMDCMKLGSLKEGGRDGRDGAFGRCLEWHLPPTSAHALMRGPDGELE